MWETVGIFLLWWLGTGIVFLLACGAEALLLWGRDRWRWVKWFNWN